MAGVGSMDNKNGKTVLNVKMLDGFSIIFDGRELVDGRQAGSQFFMPVKAVPTVAS